MSTSQYSQKKKVGIIGSGLGGLATAIRLANRGFEVDIYEKNAQPGGKIFELRTDGYRFDGGASIFTLPELLVELFHESGEDIRDYLRFSKLPISGKYFFNDRSSFTFYDDKDKLFEELKEGSAEPISNLRSHLKKAETAFRIGSDVFLFSSLFKLRNYFTKAYLKVILQVRKLDVFRSMHRANRSRFKDDKLVRIFDRYAIYNGSDPFRAPATLNMIAHLENNLGTFFPDKGVYQIISSLKTLAEKKGVRFFFKNPVTEIKTRKGKAYGLLVKGEEKNYDLIVSDADARYLHKHMLKPSRKHRIHKQEPSSSALLFYWGINRTFPELDLHNVFFSDDMRGEFRHIFKTGELQTDPTIYLFISSKRVPTDAPEGCENWYVMLNSSPDTGQNWAIRIEEARKLVIRKLSKILDTDVDKVIVNEKVVWPKSIERGTWSPGGSLYGSASNSMFASFLRHPNFSGRIKNLYFVGGSVHPGGGIPLCLGSAKIVDQLIQEDFPGD